MGSTDASSLLSSSAMRSLASMAVQGDQPGIRALASSMLSLNLGLAPDASALPSATAAGVTSATGSLLLYPAASPSAADLHCLRILMPTLDEEATSIACMEACNRAGQRLLSELYGEYLAHKIQSRSQRRGAPESDAQESTPNRDSTNRGAEEQDQQGEFLWDGVLGWVPQACRLVVQEIQSMSPFVPYEKVLRQGCIRTDEYLRATFSEGPGLQASSSLGEQQQPVVSPSPARIKALLSLLDTCLQLDLVKHHYCAVTRRTQLQGHNQTQDQDTKVDDTYCALLLGPRPGAKEGEALSELLQQHKQAFLGDPWAVLRHILSHLKSESGPLPATADAPQHQSPQTRDLVSLAEVFLHLAAQTVDSLSSNGWLGFSGNSVRTFLGTEKLQLLRVLPVLCVFGSLPVRHWAAKGPQNSSLPFWKDVLLAVASLFKKEPVIHAFGDVAFIPGVLLDALCCGVRVNVPPSMSRSASEGSTDSSDVRSRSSRSRGSARSGDRSRRENGARDGIVRERPTRGESAREAGGRESGIREGGGREGSARESSSSTREGNARERESGGARESKGRSLTPDSGVPGRRTSARGGSPGSPRTDSRGRNRSRGQVGEPGASASASARNRSLERRLSPSMEGRTERPRGPEVPWSPRHAAGRAERHSSGPLLGSERPRERHSSNPRSERHDRGHDRGQGERKEKERPWGGGGGGGSARTPSPQRVSRPRSPSPHSSASAPRAASSSRSRSGPLESASVLYAAGVRGNGTGSDSTSRRAANGAPGTSPGASGALLTPDMRTPRPDASASASMGTPAAHPGGEGAEGGGSAERKGRGSSGKEHVHVKLKLNLSSAFEQLPTYNLLDLASSAGKSLEELSLRLGKVTSQIAAMRLAAAAVSSEGGEGEATAGAAGAPEGPRPGRAMKRAKLGLRVALYGLVVEAMLNVSAWCCLLVQHCALKRARAATVVLESATESMPASVLSSFEAVAAGADAAVELSRMEAHAMLLLLRAVRGAAGMLAGALGDWPDTGALLGEAIHSDVHSFCASAVPLLLARCSRATLGSATSPYAQVLRSIHAVGADLRGPESLDKRGAPPGGEGVSAAPGANDAYEGGAPRAGPDGQGNRASSQPESSTAAAGPTVSVAGTESTPGVGSGQTKTAPRTTSPSAAQMMALQGLLQTLLHAATILPEAISSETPVPEPSPASSPSTGSFTSLLPASMRVSDGAGDSSEGESAGAPAADRPALSAFDQAVAFFLGADAASSLAYPGLPFEVRQEKQAVLRASLAMLLTESEVAEIAKFLDRLLFFPAVLRLRCTLADIQSQTLPTLAFQLCALGTPYPGSHLERVYSLAAHLEGEAILGEAPGRPGASVSLPFYLLATAAAAAGTSSGAAPLGQVGLRQHPKGGLAGVVGVPGEWGPAQSAQTAQAASNSSASAASADLLLLPLSLCNEAGNLCLGPIQCPGGFAWLQDHAQLCLSGLLHESAHGLLAHSPWGLGQLPGPGSARGHSAGAVAAVVGGLRVGGGELWPTGGAPAALLLRQRCFPLLGRSVDLASLAVGELRGHLIRQLAQAVHLARMAPICHVADAHRQLEALRAWLSGIVHFTRRALSATALGAAYAPSLESLPSLLQLAARVASGRGAEGTGAEGRSEPAGEPGLASLAVVPLHVAMQRVVGDLLRNFRWSPRGQKFIRIRGSMGAVSGHPLAGAFDPNTNTLDSAQGAGNPTAAAADGGVRGAPGAYPQGSCCSSGSGPCCFGAAHASALVALLGPEGMHGLVEACAGFLAQRAVEATEAGGALLERSQGAAATESGTPGADHPSQRRDHQHQHHQQQQEQEQRLGEGAGGEGHRGLFPEAPGAPEGPLEVADNPFVHSPAFKAVKNGDQGPAGSGGPSQGGENPPSEDASPGEGPLQNGIVKGASQGVPDSTGAATTTGLSSTSSSSSSSVPLLLLRSLGLAPIAGHAALPPLQQQQPSSSAGKEEAGSPVAGGPKPGPTAAESAEALLESLQAVGAMLAFLSLLDSALLQQATSRTVLQAPWLDPARRAVPEDGQGEAPAQEGLGQGQGQGQGEGSTRGSGTGGAAPSAPSAGRGHTAENEAYKGSPDGTPLAHPGGRAGAPSEVGGKVAPPPLLVDLLSRAQDKHTLLGRRKPLEVLCQAANLLAETEALHASGPWAVPLAVRTAQTAVSESRMGRAKAGPFRTSEEGQGKEQGVEEGGKMEFHHLFSALQLVACTALARQEKENQNRHTLGQPQAQPVDRDLSAELALGGSLVVHLLGQRGPLQLHGLVQSAAGGTGRRRGEKRGQRASPRGAFERYAAEQMRASEDVFRLCTSWGH